MYRFWMIVLALFSALGGQAGVGAPIASFVLPILYGPTGLSANNPAAKNDIVLVLGYSSPGDGGGGYFQSTGADCPQITVSLTPDGSGNTLNPGVPTISGTFSATPVSGMTVVSSGAAKSTPRFDPILPNPTSNQIVLYEPPYARSTTSTITLSTENGGSYVRSIVGSSGTCFKRISSNYSQMEWGATLAKDVDDSSALQNWIESSQPHIAMPGSSTIAYPLFCDTTQGAISGPPSQAVAEDPSLQPIFTINGKNSFYNGFNGLSNPVSNGLGTGAMLIMVANAQGGTTANAQCAIHSMGLVAEAQTSAGPFYDVLHANGKSNLIDQHSYLANGFHNVVAAGGGANFEAYDSAFNNSYDDNVTIGTPNAKVLRNSIAGAGTGYANGASGTNLKFGGVDLVLEDNIIQQAAGWGVNLSVPDRSEWAPTFSTTTAAASPAHRP